MDRIKKKRVTFCSKFYQTLFLILRMKRSRFACKKFYMSLVKLLMKLQNLLINCFFVEKSYKLEAKLVLFWVNKIDNSWCRKMVYGKKITWTFCIGYYFTLNLVNNRTFFQSPLVDLSISQHQLRLWLKGLWAWRQPRKKLKKRPRKLWKRHKRRKCLVIAHQSRGVIKSLKRLKWRIWKCLKRSWNSMIFIDQN